MRNFFSFFYVFLFVLFSIELIAIDHSGTINDDETWFSNDNPHIVTGNITIADENILTIQAGCLVKFNEYCSINIEGGMMANGTADEHIIFTSNQSSQAPGDWGYLNFNQPIYDCLLNYCDIDYGGYNYGNIRIRGVVDKLTITNSTIENSGEAGINIYDYYASGSNPVISDCVISNNTTNGIYCYDSSSYPQIHDCVIQNNGSAAIRTFGDNVKAITGNMNISGNSPNAIIVEGETINSGTWLYHNVPYFITGNVIVNDAETLTIEPLNQLKFSNNSKLEVKGSLIADGTPSEHITFTSSQTTPAAGDWDRIYFNQPDASCIVDYCDISYGGSSNGNFYLRGCDSNVSITNSTIHDSGSDGIYITDNYTIASIPTIADCAINDNARYGIYCYNASSYPLISDCNIENNGSYAIRTYGDNVKAITGDMIIAGNNPDAIRVETETINTGTWLYHDVPYIIIGNIVVNATDTLTIEPLNQLKFSNNSKLEVRGSLIADGSPSEHITFTSSQTTPAAGDWDRIYFNQPDASCIVDYCDISYGGSSNGNIYLRGCDSNVSITNSTIHDSGSDGIYITDNYTIASIPTIADCAINENTGYGIYCYNASSYPLISDCNIENNGSYAIRTYGDNVKAITGNMIISGNSPDAINVGNETITSGIWLYHNVPYHITGDINVGDGDTLTIEPLNELKFYPDCELQVLGKLIADGSASEHITFTSAQATPAAGDWDRIYFNQADAGSILDYCDISYGGENNGSIYFRGSYDNVSITNCVIENGESSGLYLSDNYAPSSSPTISNCLINNHGDFGIYCYNANSNPIISDCTIQNNGNYAIRTHTNHLASITGSMNITGNNPNQVIALGANLSTQTWLNHNVPYVIESNFQVNDGETLTISEGIELKFNNDVQFSINGVLIAEGTISDHIIFTSKQDAPTAGDWRYLFFNNSDNGSSIEYCDFSYGGSINSLVRIEDSDSISFSNCSFSHSENSGLFIGDYSQPVIDSCSFSENETYGIYVNHATGYPYISNCSINNNGSYAIYTFANNLREITGSMNIYGNVPNSIRARGNNVYDSFWLNHGVPYDLTSEVFVQNGYDLTIAAGDTIRFEGNHGMTVYGSFNAIGTDDNKIKFTRSPSYSGYWDNIYLYNLTESCQLSYCDFTYGGYSNGTLYFRGTGDNVDIDHCNIKYSNSNGLYIIENSDPKINNCVIRENSSFGIYINGYSQPVFGSNVNEWNDIYNNGLDDIPSYDFRNGWSDVVAKYIYWGVDDFQSINSRIIDNDDNINLGIVNFSPWESSPHGDLQGNEHAGLISADATSDQINWTVANGSVHYVTAPVTVDVGVTVTIEDGVEVRFTEGAYLEVEGTLNADGSNSEGITFSRYENNIEWQGIIFKSGSDGFLDNCLIEYATYNQGIGIHEHGYGIYLASELPEITNNTVRFSEFGIYANGVFPTALSGNQFKENNTGIFLKELDTPILNSPNSIENNSLVGIHLFDCSGRPSISNQTIINNAGIYGAFYLENCGEFELGSDNFIQNNLFPLTINMASYADSSSLVPTNVNTNNAIQVYGGTTVSDFYWYDFAVPYLIMESPIIDRGDLLEISAGVEVRFENGKKFDILGNLNTNGIEGNEIYFTHQDSIDSWQGLNFQEGASGNLEHTYVEYVADGNGYGICADSVALSLNDCVIQNCIYGFFGNDQQSNITNTIFQNNDYGYFVQNTDDPNANFGAGNIFSNNANCGIYYKDCFNLGTISNLILQNNQGYGALLIANSGNFVVGTNTIDGNDWPLSIDCGSFPDQISLLPSSGNLNNDIQVITGVSSKTGNWPSFAELNYIITGNISVGDSGSLTILEGNTLKFNYGKKMEVFGTLSAIGDEITFTGNEQAQWNGIKCFNGSIVTIDSCTIEYASYSNGAGIFVNQCSPDISNSTIRYNVFGIYIDNGSPIISNNLITENSVGIRYQNTASPSLTFANTISQNNSAGIYYKDCSGTPNIENQILTNNNGNFGAIYLENSGIFNFGLNSITNNTFPLTINAASYPNDSSLNNIPTSGNDNDDLQVYGGSTNANSFTWKTLNQPLDYIVTNDLSIATGGSLTISDGVNVYFDQNCCLNVYGTLIGAGSTVRNPDKRIVAEKDKSKKNVEKTMITKLSQSQTKERDTGILFSRWQNDENWEGLLFRSNSTGDLDHCTIEYATGSGGYGVYASSAAQITLDNCELKNNNYGFYGHTLQSTSIVSFTNNQVRDNNTGIYFQNTSDLVLDSTNIVSSNLTGIYFHLCDSPVNNIDLENNVNYGIKFSSCISPVNNGNVNNCGNGVFFTDCSDLGTIDNFSLTNNTEDFGALRISNSGDFTLGAGLLITGNSWPLSIDCGSFASNSSNIPTSGNSNNDIQVISGTGTNSGTWHLFTDIDYIVDGFLEIDDTLTIAAGNTFLCENNSQFNIDGTLKVLGTITEPVIITRKETTDEWNGLRFRNNSNSQLNYCTIEYATNGTSYGVYASFANSLILDNCLLQSNDYGIYTNLCDPELINNQIINNDYGIYLNGNSTPVFGSNLSEWNDIYGNSTYDLYNGDNDIDAKYVYWGTENSAAIENQIYDENDDIVLGLVNYMPYTNAAHDTEIIGGLEAPQNVQISIDNDSLTISWNPVSGATSYKIYSSDNPETSFTEDMTGTFSDESWSAPLPAQKKFYYVKAYASFE